MGTLYRKHSTRWVLEGKCVKAGTPGARQVRQKLPRWYGDYTDAQGVRRTVSLMTDKGVSNKALAKLEAEAEKERMGLMPAAAKHLDRPLVEHVEDYRVLHLETQNSTPDHIVRQVRRIRRIMDGCGFVRLADLLNGKARVGKFLADERKRTSRFGVVTSNHHLAAARSFCRWLVEEERLPRNPLAGLRPVEAKGEERHRRRVLAQADFTRFLTSVRESHKVRAARRSGGWRFTPLDRYRLYLTAARTGLRASELAGLTRANFDFEALTLRVQASLSKNRTEAILPLHPDLAAELRPWVESLPEGQMLWPGRWAKLRLGAKLVRPDLAAAGIHYRTADGCYDFHALRGQFITDLALAQVHPSMAKELARHSTIHLTSDIYTRVGKAAELAPALSRLRVPRFLTQTAEGWASM